MSFQSVRGGVITSIGTNLSLKTSPLGSFLPKTPRTLIFGSGTARSQQLNFGFKSVLRPSFDVKYRRSFGFNVDSRISNFNPFKDFGIQRNRQVLFSTTDLFYKNRRAERTFSTTAAKTTVATPTSTGTQEETLVLEKDVSGYRVVIPLSNNEKCLFTIDRDVTIKGFVDMVKEEDSNVKGLALFSKDGIKIAGSTKLVEVVRGPFQMVVNGKKFQVSPRSATSATITSTSAFSSESYEDLKRELAPLYRQKSILDEKSESQASWVMYAGLVYLTAQMAFLARLTWWDFNWDIMEPVTYFVTFGTSIIGYLYFAVTRREYTFGDIRTSVLQNRMFKNYVKNDFPIEKYFTLEQKMNAIDKEAMDRLRWELDREPLHVKPAEVVA